MEQTTDFPCTLVLNWHRRLSKGSTRSCLPVIRDLLSWCILTIYALRTPYCIRMLLRYVFQLNLDTASAIVLSSPPQRRQSQGSAQSWAFLLRALSATTAASGDNDHRHTSL